MATRLRSLLRVGLASGLAFAAAWALLPQAAALTITPAPISFTAVVLDGTVQTVAGSTSAWRADADGEAGGWNVTVTATDLDNGVGNTIPVSGLEIRLLDANIARVSGHPLGPDSTQTIFAALSGTPLKIAEATGGQGNGIYDLTPDFQLTVPAESYTGTYTATVTVDISVGP